MRGDPDSAAVGASPGPTSDARPAAVLLDMDGLLVETAHLWTVAEHELAASLPRLDSLHGVSHGYLGALAARPTAAAT